MAIGRALCLRLRCFWARLRLNPDGCEGVRWNLRGLDSRPTTRCLDAPEPKPRIDAGETRNRTMRLRSQSTGPFPSARSLFHPAPRRLGRHEEKSSDETGMALQIRFRDVVFHALRRDAEGQ